MNIIQGNQPNQSSGRVPRRAVVGDCCVELLPQSPYSAAYTPELAVIGFAFESQAGVHAFATDRRAHFRAKPNGLAYVPGGCDVYSHSDRGGEYLTITFKPEHDDQAYCDRRFSDIIDPVAISAAQRLRATLLTCNSIDPLIFEQLVQTLNRRVAHVTGCSHIETHASLWMTARRLRCVDELIEAKLDDTLTVQELAKALGLSMGFFSRALKASIGKAPHDYIIERRISRARTLLETGCLDLSAVAFASGFASHAHMTATFRSRLGVTPSQLRSMFV